ncbi:MFS general substrate transporter [Fistulina hepatica ATCC 64428]|nr:MFS general substrate transporter [Fistulina hepatica ATCC 64428]
MDVPFRPSTSPDLGKVSRAAVIRKIDLRLLPIMTILYLLSFLDRGNIGNAKIAGMTSDVGLVGLQYNIIAAVFFVSYAFADVPANIALKLIRPSVWLPSIMVAWGVVMTLMTLCHSFDGLIVARIFLGLAEAGLSPGIVFYLSRWYRRRDLAFRIAMYLSSASTAGLIQSAYCIEKMEGIGGLHGWQWIFCLEGIATVIIATAAYFLIYDTPATATFLTPQERAFVLNDLVEDRGQIQSQFSSAHVIQALTDYRTWLMSLIFLGPLVAVYSMSLFLPTIVTQMGFTAVHAQLLTVPPYVVGCISTVVIGYLSDRLNVRGPFIAACCTVSLAGYAILYAQDAAGISYFGTIVAACGIFPSVAITLTWCASIAADETRRTVTIGFVNAIGNLGGICASFLYLPGKLDTGHAVLIGFMALTVVTSLITTGLFVRSDKRAVADVQSTDSDGTRNETKDERWRCAV